MMGKLRFIASQGWYDLRYDWRMSGILVASIAAILAPLLLLLGLKTGIVTQMRQNLLADPHNLEIIIYQNAHLTRDWFEAMRKQEAVAFIIPRTRTINATMDIVDRRRVLPAVELLPTGSGDPLLESVRVPRHWSEVLISFSMAQSLDVQVGDKLRGILKRRVHGQQQSVELVLQVLGVVPEQALSRDALFAVVDLLTMAEDYRDGYAVPEFNVHAGISDHNEPRIYANARIYARDLESVASLAGQLRAQNLEVRTHAREIENMQIIDGTLTLIFAAVTLLSSLGGAMVFGGSLWVNIERKKQQLALLRLLGCRRGDVMLIPVLQSCVIAGAAFILSVGLYAMMAYFFNVHLPKSPWWPEAAICRLQPCDMVIVVLLMLMVVLLSSLAAGYRGSRVDPSVCLRAFQ